MKAFYSTMILSCALFVSCTSDDIVSEGTLSEGQGIKVIGSIANSRTTYETVVDGTKTFTKTLWEEKDAIGLSHSGQNNVKYEAGNKGASTTFTAATADELKAAEGTEVYAYYPYKEGAVGTDGVTVTLSRNEQQIWKDNRVYYCKIKTGAVGDALDFLYAKGTVKDGVLALNNFKHRYAFIKMTVSKEVIEKAGLKAENGCQINIDTELRKKIVSYSSDNFDVDNESGGTASERQINYFIPGETFTDANSVTCYVAVFPFESTGDQLNFRLNVATGDIRLLATKPVPEGGMKAGHVYSVTLGASGEEETVDLEGEYNCTFIDNEKKEATFTGTLEKAGEKAYRLSGIPACNGMGTTPMINLNFTYNASDKSLTLEGGQFVEDPAGGFKKFTFWFANSKDCIDYEKNITYFHFDGTTKEGTLGTKDSNVTYVGTYSENGGKPVFTFKDGGKWEKQAVAGIVGTKEEVQGGTKPYPDTYKAYYTLFDLVLTKK